MNIEPRKRPSVAQVLDEGLTDDRLDRVLEECHGEIEALLEEARKAKAEGRYAPLEPLHEFLARARERLQSSR